MLKNLPQEIKDFIDKYASYGENKKYLYTLYLASPPLFSFLKQKPQSIPFIFKHLKHFYSQVEYIDALKDISIKEYKDFYLKNLIRIFIKDIHSLVSKSLAWKEHSFLIDALITCLFNNYKNSFEKKGQIEIKEILNRVFIIGMGKLSTLEINYRSDIDLVFVYDGKIEKKDRIFFDTLIKNFIKELENYFFVDTRLRPFGTKGPLLISLEDLEEYFFKYARPWEKLAYFRSRIILGPREKFDYLKDLIKNFVFSSLDNIKEEIIKLKNLLLENKEKLELINIKEGQGGIRYIEFLAQGLSLIFSKKFPKDKIFAKDTLSLLELLIKEGILLKDDGKFLKEAYIFYRDIEHLLQLKDFKPRYSFHIDSEESKRISYILNLDFEEFKTKLLNYRQRVVNIFKRYFEESDKVYFSSLTKRKLKLLGLKDYEKLFEKYKNVISYRGFLKENFEKIDALFENILPFLLEGKYKDVKFNNFLDFVQNSFFLNYFYQLKDNEKALKILTYILESKYFTNILLEYPDLSEEIFKVNFLNPNLKFLDLVNTILDTKEEDRKKLKKTYELSLYLAYKLSNLDIVKLAFNYSLLTHAFIYALAKELEIKASIYALGKLGGYELLYFGDLDLIFISKSLEEKEENLKTLPKLVEKLEGLEYEVDLRLRPYGNQSEIAPPLSYYKKYFDKVARLWERFAYTKAKDIYLKLKDFENILKEFLFKKELTKKDLDEALNLLDRLINTYHKDNPIKYSYGGLIALEFVGYTYQLFYKFKEPNLFKVLSFLANDIKIDFTKDYLFLKNLELEKKLEKDNFYLLDEEKQRINDIEKKVKIYFDLLREKLKE